MYYLLELIKDKFPISKELKFLDRFAVKAIPYYFGTYHDIKTFLRKVFFVKFSKKDIGDFPRKRNQAFGTIFCRNQKDFPDNPYRKQPQLYSQSSRTG
jgi:hypothetical protein